MTPPLSDHERERFTEFLKETEAALAQEPMRLPDPDDDAAITKAALAYAYRQIARQDIVAAFAAALAPPPED